MKDIKESSIHKSKKNFTLKKFWLTGGEVFVEMRSSLHTGRGKGGLLIFLGALAWGVYRILIREYDKEDDMLLFIPLLWCTMGLSMMINLQNHKLLYLLPISRKEFAAAQIRKMIWGSLIVSGVMVIFFLCRFHDAWNLGMNVIFKALPISASMGCYHIASIQPIKGKGTVGSKIYHISYLVWFVNMGIMFLNCIFTVDSWKIVDLIIPVLNYIVSIYTIIYIYKKVAYSDVYYDEL